MQTCVWFGTVSAVRHRNWYDTVQQACTVLLAFFGGFLSTEIPKTTLIASSGPSEENKQVLYIQFYLLSSV